MDMAQENRCHWHTPWNLSPSSTTKLTRNTFHGDVLLVRASKQLPALKADRYLGWKDVLRGKLEIYEVPGHQQNMLLEPNVCRIADELEVRLQSFRERSELQDQGFLVGVQ